MGMSTTCGACCPAAGRLQGAPTIKLSSLVVSPERETLRKFSDKQPG